MSLKNPDARVLWATLAALFLGGCHCRIHDPQTGRTYYSDQWVAADGYRGPLTFEDHRGRKIILRDGHVTRLSRQEYIEAIDPEPSSIESPATQEHR